jgi:hypothetical protein
LTSEIMIRSALHAERSSLEALQWRASLANRGDREALLANPDAIAMPVEQITDGHVFVAERDGVIVGFAEVVATAGRDRGTRCTVRRSQPLETRRWAIARRTLRRCGTRPCLAHPARRR